MSVKSILAALCVLVAGSCGATAALADAPAASPDDAPAARPTRIFKLLNESATAAEDLEVEEEVEVWQPGIRTGTLDLSLSLGFAHLSGTLLEREQMMYRFTTDATYWGDVLIEAQAAFSPVVRIGYTLKPWLALEGYAGVSFSETKSTVTNRWTRKNSADATAEEFNPFDGSRDPDDARKLEEADQLTWEMRSLITLNGGLGVLVYPLNIGKDGSGRWHPYVTGQFGVTSYDMNSNFTTGTAGSSDIAFGAGLRMLAERTVSIRIEATLHSNSIEFTPAPNFIESNTGSIRVPLIEYPRDADGGYDERLVTEFTSQDLSYVAWTVGFQGSF
ncbi:MAG: hypothetical protein IPK64_11550 [bacterium]|nr:hypothetical protein [bacterium]